MPGPLEQLVAKWLDRGVGVGERGRALPCCSGALVLHRSIVPTREERGGAVRSTATLRASPAGRTGEDARSGVRARPARPEVRHAGNVRAMDAGATRLDRLRLARAERPALASFLGVFLSTLLCFLAIGAVLPVLPRYVKGPIGAGDVAVGVVVGAFALTAFVGRPLGGRLADVRGRKWVHVVGLVICAVAGAMLFLPLGVAGLIFARLVVGFGDGWVFTSGVRGSSTSPRSSAAGRRSGSSGSRSGAG